MAVALDPVRHPGNEALFRALDLSLLSTFIGVPLHVHAEGLRGTGKTTIIRSVRGRLPKIYRLRGCPHNCLPWAPHCPLHRGLSPEELAATGVERIPMPFAEISHSAKVGTVGGSIDLARLADRGRPEVALLPGLIPRANRGIIFVDEINRLADTAPELADILLDVMGTKPGRLQIEETGLPAVDLAVSVSVWAASNPDEDPGPLEDIRKQLSDRFDFVVAMERPSTVASVVEILRSAEERQAALAAATFRPRWAAGWGDGRDRDGGEGRGRDGGGGRDRDGGYPPEQTWAGVRETAAASSGEAAGSGDTAGLGEGASPDAGAKAAGEEPAGTGAAPEWDWESLGGRVRAVRYPREVERLVASLYVDFGLESLRAVEAIHHGARLNCVLERRPAVTPGDVAAVAAAALQHRLDVSSFARIMDHLSRCAKVDRPGPGTADAAAGSDLGSAGDGRAAEDRDGWLRPARPDSPAGSDGRAPGPSPPGGAGSGTPSREAPGEVAGLRGRRQAASGPGGPGPGTGWSLIRALLRGTAFGRSNPGSSGEDGGPPAREAAAPGEGAGSGSGGERGGGRGLGRGMSGPPTPVAPPHRARPLREILLEVEAAARGPSFPVFPGSPGLPETAGMVGLPEGPGPDRL